MKVKKVKNLTLGVVLASSIFVSCASNKNVNEERKTYTLTEPAKEVKKEEKKFDSERAYYAFNSYKLCASCEHNKKILEQITSDVKSSKSDSLKIEITGHADERGTFEYNDILSRKRAESVADYIKEKTGKSSIVLFKGKREPIVKNATTEAEHKKNRRVEIVISDF